MNEPSLPRADKRAGKPTHKEMGTLDLSDTIDCPLCAGRGKLGRLEFFEKTGMREPSLIAELSAKQAVQSMHDKLWGDFRAQLTEQVKTRTQELDKTIQSLTGEKRELEQDVDQLKKARERELEQARQEQANKDREELLKEKAELQDKMAELQGTLSQREAELEAANKTVGLEVKDAIAKIKEEEEKQRAELQKRINEMNDALTQERQQKVELTTKLERLEHETETRIFEARKAEIEKQEELLRGKMKEEEEERKKLQVELMSMREQAKLYPKQEEMAVEKAIQDLEKQLHSKDLDVGNLQKQRDALTEELTEARRKLEATKGKVEERTFEEMAADIPGVWVEDWSSKKKSGDYHIGLYDRDGEKLQSSKIVVDNKDVGRLTDKEIDKLVRDAEHHKVAMAAMVVRDELAMRQKDKDARFALVKGVTVLRTTREWFQRDLDMLKPLMRRQAEEGPDFMKRNLAVASEVRSHLKSIDKVERFMRLARENAERAEKELRTYRDTIEDVCRNAGARSTSTGDEEE